MSNIIEVNDDNFEQEVLNSDIPVLVDFGASWCNPCKRQEPVLEKFAENNFGKIKVCKIDIDEAYKTTQKYSIHSVPTLIAFVNGNVFATKTGLSTLVQIQTMFP